jgi:hypothetical protein
VYLVNLLGRELDVERIRHKLDVLNSLHANDGEYVGGLVEKVCQSLSKQSAY